MTLPSTSCRWPDGAGTPAPLGAAYLPDSDAYNFALYSTYASAWISTSTDERIGAPRLLTDPGSSRPQKWPGVALSPPGGRSPRRRTVRLPGGRAFRPRRWASLRSGESAVGPLCAQGVFPTRLQPPGVRNPGPTVGRAPLGVLPPRQLPSHQAERGVAEASCSGPRVAPRHGTTP